MKQGRQSKYTEAVAEEIIDRLCDGEPLRKICRDDHMPPWRTVYHWIEDREDFAARIARARELGQDAIAEDCLKIADDSVDVQHSKLRIETRIKLLAKWNPRKYGDRQTIEHEVSPDAKKRPDWFEEK